MKPKPSTAARTAAASLALGAVLAAATPASAGGTLDVDFNFATLVGPERLLYGVAGRAGWRFDLGPAWIQPEAGGEYMAVPCCLNGVQIHVARVLGGARLGATDRIGGVVEPSLFGHAGYGWLAPSMNGPTFDVGVALDVRLVPRFRFGVQGAYNVVTVPPSPSYLAEVMSPYTVQWVSFGVHAGVSF
jgi:hypothetical protein